MANADVGQIKVGRQTNAKSTPGERNAFFDSKVLSRLHAEIWEQGGKVRGGSPFGSRSRSQDAELTFGL